MAPIAKPAAQADVAAIVRLRVAVAAKVDLARVPDVLGAETAPWLGEVQEGEPGADRHYACDLELRVGQDRWATFRKSAIVSLGEPIPNRDGWTVPVEWRAASFAPLFPVFVGRVAIRADRLEIDGFYAPPFGVVGYVLDRAVLGMAARGTARWFLRLMAGALA